MSNNRKNNLIELEIIFCSKHGIWMRKVRCSYLWRRVCLTNGKGFVQEKQEWYLAPRAFLSVQFPTTASWMQWGDYFKWSPTSCLLSSIFHLLLFILHFALRSWRAGQWAAQTDGGLAPLLVQWADPMLHLAERSLDLLYFLCQCLHQSCHHLWLYLGSSTWSTL